MNKVSNRLQRPSKKEVKILWTNLWKECVNLHSGKNSGRKLLKIADKSDTPSGRRAIIVDLALSATGSQLINSILPNVSPNFINQSVHCSFLFSKIDKDQRALLYEAVGLFLTVENLRLYPVSQIRSHVVTLRGCKTGSKVIWLL